MVWEGKDAVKTGRVLLGATNPLASAPGTSESRFGVLRPLYMLIEAVLYSPW